jgi:hypothetical protein
MTNYVQSTNFATKDALPSGDPLKIVKGTEINTEFNNIAVAVATKADLNSPTLVSPALGTPSSGNLANTVGLPIVAGTTGTLPVARGGTGATTLTSGALLKGAGTGAVAAASAADIVGQIGATAVQNATNASTVTTITTNQVLNATAGAAVGAVGTYAFLTTGANIQAGGTVAGSLARYASANSRTDTGDSVLYLRAGNAPAGTWRLMGHLSVEFAYFDLRWPSVFLRIS